MIFNSDIAKERFDEYVRNHPTKSHFMQSVAWGELCEKEKGDTAFYTGLEENGEIKAAALLLLHKPAVFPPYIYCPRGFVADFSNEALITQLTKAVAAFAGEKGAMFFKIDPDVERREMRSDGTPVEGGFDNSAVENSLRALGYRHRGYNLGFERKLPRFTFRVDLTPDEETIKKRIVGNVMKNVRKGEGYPSKIELGAAADMSEFFRLMETTSERDDFFCYPKEYYQSFYDVLSTHGMARLFLGKVYPKKILSQLQDKLDELHRVMPTYKKEHHIRESQLTEQRLLREIASYTEKTEKYPDEVTASAHLVVEYGEHAWAVHAGSDAAFSETFINNRVYLFKLLSCKGEGRKWLDQFGTVGDPQNHKLRSLHEFKRQFGGRYIEFIGEYDYIINAFWYFLYEKALPVYRNVRFSIKEAMRRLKR